MFANLNKFKAVLQSEVTECGLACLVMILTYHGHRTDLQTLRRKFSISQHGTTLEGLMAMADQSNLSPRPLRVELKSLGAVRKPAILHWGLDHYVVLEKVKGRQLIIHDPALGTRKLHEEEVSKHFTGVVLELLPTSTFEKKEEVTPVRLTDLWQRISGIKDSLVKLFLLAFLLQTIALVTPLFQQLVVDDAITKQDIDFLAVLAFGFGMLGIINVGIGWLRSQIMLYFSTDLNFQVTVNLFRHLLRLPIDYFEKRHIGDVLSRFGSLSPITSLFTSGFIAIILDGIMAISTLAVAFLYNVKLTFIMLGFLLLGFIINLIIFPYQKRKNEEILYLTAKEDTNFLESVRGVQAIKLFGQESIRETQWQNLSISAINEQLTLSKFNINIGVLSGIISAMSSVLILYMSAKLVIDGEMTIGMLFAYQAYSGQAMSRLSALIGQLMSFRMLKLHLVRLADIIHTTPEFLPDDDDKSSIFSKSVQGNIGISNLGYRYGDHEQWIFREINLEIKQGEMIAIVGLSGCGKTTLLKLMLGILEPSEGDVFVDDNNLKSINKQFYRGAIGVVMQDDQLFSGSIADNISFFDSNIDRAFVEQCARDACVHDDILNSTMGYDTPIGDMGTTLSGGQKQRIFIARALYRRPRILFLDEGTANLDLETERKLVDFLADLTITRIVIAHRPAVTKVADCVLLLQNGTIREHTRLENGHE